MRRIENHARAERLIEQAVVRFELDLTGTTVLTEAASGPFVVTPLLAARAGASVIAVTRDSRFAAAGDVHAETLAWADRLGVADRIEVHIGAGGERAADADLVTNLGFVRPLDAGFVTRLRPGAAVSLMCEPWEARGADVDLAACRAAGVPVLGTNEREPRLQTFRFVGMLAVRLLLELEVEVMMSRLLVIASEPFASPIVELLRDSGASIRLVDVTDGGELRESALLAELVEGVDAVVVAEHRDRRAVIGGRTGIPLEPLVAAGTSVAHIAGRIDDPQRRLRRHPEADVPPGWMTVTTDRLGPRPVVDLHAAGLRVGQSLLEAMRRTANAAAAEVQALADPLALAVGAP